MWNSTFKDKPRKPLKRSAFKKKPYTPKRSTKPKVKSKPKNAQRGVRAAKMRAWTAFARFIRNRDHACITCGKETTEAGHFIHNGDKPNKNLGGNMLWFDERNVNGQEAYCNRHRMGNTALYSLRLIEKHGAGIIEELHRLHRTAKKWTLEEINGIADKYESLVK